MNYIGIDLGGTRIKIGLLKDNELAASAIITAQKGQGLAAQFGIIDESIQQLVNEQNLHSIDGIAMAFPGIVNPVTKKVTSTSKKYEDAPALDLEYYYKQKWNTTFLIDNDARLACLGEWQYGAGKGCSNMVMCTLGTGFGSSVILNNNIIYGQHFQAGILGGHTIIDYTDAKNECSCGGYGCVESIASTWKLKELAQKHPLFEKSTLSQKEIIDFSVVFAESETGDELATLLISHCVYAWSIGITNLIHAYDPERIVVGGGIVHASNQLIPQLQKNISQRAWCPSGVPQIVAAAHPDTAALLGAITLFNKIEHE